MNKKPQKPVTKRKFYRKVKKFIKKVITSFVNFFYEDVPKESIKPITKTPAYRWFKKTGISSFLLCGRIISLVILLIVLAFSNHADAFNQENTITRDTFADNSCMSETRREVASRFSHEQNHKCEIIPEFTLMEVTMTGYCPCKDCCGIWAQYKKTKIGTTPVEGRTLGVDKNIIPLGSLVVFDKVPTGLEYLMTYKGNTKFFCAEDTGKFSGNHIDVYYKNHQDALNLGNDKVATIRIYKK